MGIRTEFNSNNVHTFGAPQLIDIIVDTAPPGPYPADPWPISANLGWCEDIKVHSDNGTGTYVGEFGTTSKLSWSNQFGDFSSAKAVGHHYLVQNVEQFQNATIIDSMIGVISEVYISNPRIVSVSKYIGFEADLHGGGGQSITDAIGFHFKADTFVGGIPTNLTGILIDDVIQGTNNYAIKTGLGKVQIGDTLAQTCNSGATGSTIGASFTETVVSTSGFSRALSVVASSNPAGASTSNPTGIEGRADIATVATITASGTHSGVNGYVRINAGTASGTVFAAIGVGGGIQGQNASVTVASAHAFHAYSPSQNPTTTAVGLWIEDQQVAGVTTGYSIYTNNGRARFGDVIETASGQESTGAGTALLGTNCPAVTVAAPYRWLKFRTSDGSTVYLPAWK